MDKENAICGKSITSVVCTVLFLFLLTSDRALAADVILSWERPDDSRVQGYKIYYGPANSDFKAAAKEVVSSAEQTRLDIHDLVEGQTYAFAAKSIDGKGGESVFSEVVYYDVCMTEEEAPGTNPPGEETGIQIPDRSDSGGGSGGCLIRNILSSFL